MSNPVKRDLKNGEIDINKLIKNKKKEEILEIYAKETGLPIALLSNVWDFCEKTPEKTLKKIKKNEYKNKVFNPERPVFERGQVLECANVRPLTEDEIKPKIENEIFVSDKIEEIHENENEIDVEN